MIGRVGLLALGQQAVDFLRAPVAVVGAGLFRVVFADHLALLVRPAVHFFAAGFETHHRVVVVALAGFAFPVALRLGLRVLGLVGVVGVVGALLGLAGIAGRRGTVEVFVEDAGRVAVLGQNRPAVASRFRQEGFRQRRSGNGHGPALGRIGIDQGFAQDIEGKAQGQNRKIQHLGDEMLVRLDGPFQPETGRRRRRIPEAPGCPLAVTPVVFPVTVEARLTDLEAGGEDALREDAIPLAGLDLRLAQAAPAEALDGADRDQLVVRTAIQRRPAMGLAVQAMFGAVGSGAVGQPAARRTAAVVQRHLHDELADVLFIEQGDKAATADTDAAAGFRRGGGCAHGALPIIEGRDARK